MDFIKLTKSEYRRSLIRTVFITPAVEPFFGWRKIKIVVFLAVRTLTLRHTTRYSAERRRHVFHCADFLEHGCALRNVADFVSNTNPPFLHIHA